MISVLKKYENNHQCPCSKNEKFQEINQLFNLVSIFTE